MDTTKLKIPWVIEKATEADNALRSLMSSKVVHLSTATAAIKEKRLRLREANKTYFPLSEDDK